MSCSPNPQKVINKGMCSMVMYTEESKANYFFVFYHTSLKSLLRRLYIHEPWVLYDTCTASRCTFIYVSLSQPCIL